MSWDTNSYWMMGGEIVFNTIAVPLKNDDPPIMSDKRFYELLVLKNKLPPDIPVIVNINETLGVKFREKTPAIIYFSPSNQIGYDFLGIPSELYFKYIDIEPKKVAATVPINPLFG